MIAAQPSSPEELVALGAFAGAQVLLVCISVIIANTYRDRSLLLHGAATMLGVLAVQLQFGGREILTQIALLALLGVAGMQLLDLVSHAGALRQPRRWLVGVSVGLMPLLAIAAAIGRWHLLLPAVAAWAVVVTVMMIRAWPQSQPWARWLVPGQLALTVGTAWTGWLALDPEPDSALPLAGWLTLWSATVFLASAWRSRIFSETRLRLDARNTVDPLTGLSMPVIFYDRVMAVRNLIRRYGHPSVVMLVQVENLPRLAAEFGPEVAESALLVAANRIRETLRDGDIAARLSHSRIGVLAEGISVAEGSANIASRILVAGLKEPLPAAPTEFLQFRVILAAVPVEDVPVKAMLQRMANLLDDQLKEASERRIVALGAEDLVS